MFQPRNRPATRPSSTPTIAVGQRVFVNCPVGRSGSVGLVDINGKVASAVQLADGVEVDVVAWRPRVGAEAFYRVRASSNGADGWLPAGNLRRLAVPPPPTPTPVATAAPAEEAGSRFGQRRDGGRPAPAPAPARPAGRASAPSEGGGRRFGQRH